MKLQDKVALVTGAGQGIGRAIAAAFAQEGANLSLNYYGQDSHEIEIFAEELRGYGAKVILTEGDISKEATAKQLIDRTVETFGRIDVLTNNAGICNQGLVQDLEVETWERMIEINLKSVFLTTRYSVPYMISQRSGRIINFASQIGQKGGMEVSHYAASKAGVIGFTKSIALELGQYGIMANCVAPGPIDTQMIADFDQTWRDKKQAELAIPRFGKVEEVVPSVIFLASSPEGNVYTGQTLGPNSGDVML